MAAWIKDPTIPMYGRWNHAADNEGGVDLASPGGTPVYALADGEIIGAGNFWHNPPNVLQNLGGNPGYGVLTTRVNVPGYGTQDLYYQHIDLAPNIAQCPNGCGQHVAKGQLIGYVHPGVNEVEMGFNANWGPPWQPNGAAHPGPWATDPRPMLAALMNGSGATSTTSTGPSLNIPGIGDIGPTITQWGEYAAIFTIAIMFLIIGIVLLGHNHTEVAT
jgi:hypothetical protein